MIDVALFLSIVFFQSFCAFLLIYLNSVCYCPSMSLYICSSAVPLHLTLGVDESHFQVDHDINDHGQSKTGEC